MASPSSVLFSLSKRRSNSSPQLQCEATDFSSLTGTPDTCAPNTSTSSWPENNATRPSTTTTTVVSTVDRSFNRRSVKVDVTKASVHWLEPKQRAVLHDEAVAVVDLKQKTSAFIQKDKIRPTDSAGVVARPRPDSDLLCCNETIHYLQGSDSDSESTPHGTPRRKSHACIQKQQSDSRQKLRRLSKAACQIFSKLKIIDTKASKNKDRRKEVHKSEDDSDGDDIQPIVRRRSRSLTSKVMKRFGHKEDDSPGSAKNETVQAASPTVSSKAKQKSKQCRKPGAKSHGSSSRKRASRQAPLVNFAKFDPEKYPIECSEEIERAAREREIEEGIAATDIDVSVSPSTACVHVLAEHGSGTARSENHVPLTGEASSSNATSYQVVDAPTHTTENIYDLYGSLTPSGTFIPRTVHTQIDYMHCLVPDQWNIMKSPFYWGKIDRYEADNLLDNKPEGTFLLRDSAQEEFLFSVSFCRYGRTLHARIEQWNHKFSFDAHDPGVYSSDTICGLLEHYKEPNYCMFFEPMLTNPLARVNPPSLLELGRARICQHVSYDTVCYLKLPNSLKEYLREYHYKQRVRIRRVEVDMPQLPEVKQSVVTNTCISR